jgi:hypothetical protein
MIFPLRLSWSMFTTPGISTEHTACSPAACGAAGGMLTPHACSTLEWTITDLAGLVLDAPWTGERGSVDLTRLSQARGSAKGMNAAMDNSGDALYSDARDRARQAVAKLLKGSGLRVRELTYELVITNPRDPEKGQVHIAYQDGFVSWERVTWDHWGQLETLADGTEAQVGATKIIDTLTAAP